MWWNGGPGWWPILVVMPVAMVVCVGLMVWMMGGFGRSRHDSTPRDELAEARRILAERLAAGDIDVEEYQRRLEVLAGRRRA